MSNEEDYRSEEGARPPLCAHSGGDQGRDGQHSDMTLIGLLSRPGLQGQAERAAETSNNNNNNLMATPPFALPPSRTVLAAVSGYLDQVETVWGAGIQATPGSQEVSSTSNRATTSQQQREPSPAADDLREQ